jgi:ATP-dependent Zn protease
MKKILILIILLLSSCAARKVNVDKVDSVIKTDSTSIIKQEVISTQDNHVSIVTNTDEVEVCPVSDSLPMVVNGITYKNAKIRYKKTKKVLVDTTKIKVAENTSIKVEVKKDAKVKAFKKDIDKKVNYAIYFWWLLIILLVMLFFYIHNKINKSLI